MRERPRRRRRARRAATALALVALLACAAMWAGASLFTRAGGGEEASQASATEGDGAPDVAVEEAETTVTESGLSVTGPTEFLETEAHAYLEEQIAELEEQNVTLGIVVRDLESGYELAYNAGEALYPASAIKAAYCAMVCEEFGGAGELAAVWEEIYRFGTSGEDGADELVDALAATNYTALGAIPRDECEVWAKSGWYPTDEYDLASTNDAGVVFSDCGPYVLTVMTDLPADLDGLTPLIDALGAAHDATCGDVA